MPPRVEPRTALRFVVAAARLGGACLALAIVVSAPAPEMVLALLAVVFLLVGGTVMASAWPPPFQWSVAAFAVVLARVAAGTGAAFLAALLVGLGAWLRIRTVEATAGLAVFGVAVAIIGGATPVLVLSFWFLGAFLIAARRAAGAVRVRLTHAFLTPERTAGRSLP